MYLSCTMKSKKLSSGINEEVIDIGCYGGVTINRIGEPISALYGYKTDGVITTSEEAKNIKIWDKVMLKLAV